MNKIQLIVTFDPKTGQVTLSGPINDRLFCLGLLELAKECVNDNAKQQQNKRLIEQPRMDIDLSKLTL